MSSLFHLVILFIIGIVDSKLTSIETSSRLIWTSESMTMNICQLCQCSTIPSLVNCSTISNISQSHYSSFVWDIVDFSYRQLEFIDVEQLYSLRMRHFLLNSNRIQMINDRTFDSLVEILIVLDLSNNSMKNFSFTSSLNSLKILNLSRNQIEEFPREIHRWNSLRQLDLSFNQLKTLPRFALNGLMNLTWFSLADNRNLSCIVQDSFKYLKSLQYLDLSRTNLIAIDACIFIQLIDLKILLVENLFFNCSSCWLPIARSKTTQLIGQCFLSNSSKQMFLLDDKNLQSNCEKSSIDCSIDSCEPGSLHTYRYIESHPKISRSLPKKTMEILLGSIFGIVLLFIVVFVVRWRQGKKIFCCYSFENRSRIAESMRRRRQQHKEIINSNPVVIESVVTHGANLNVSSSHQNFGYFQQETSNHKRKLYNPMFADSPSSSEQRRDENFVDDEIYCEHL